MRSRGLAVGVGCVVVAAGLLAWGWAEGGGWAFPLDDTYIHLAVARTLVESGTWGVNPGEFASASSSPAWTALLAACFALVGPREWVPLALNGLALVGVFVVLDGWFGRRWVPLLAVAAGAALPVVGSLGMEHVLHLLVTLLLARRVLDGKGGAATFALALLLPMVRYEGAFLVGAGAALALWRGRYAVAGTLVSGAALSILGFGAWTAAHGAGFLPNSLVMKGSLGTGFVTNLAANARDGAGAFALLGLVAVLSPAAGRHRDHGLLYVGAAGLHLTLASVGWYYRYEAWLLAWGVAWLALALPELRARRLATVGALVVAALLAARTFDAVRYFGGRCVYIHDAKVVLARGLARAAPGTVVALHDIGAMAFYGGAEVVDVAGLGTDTVAHLAASRRFTGPAIGALVAGRGAQVALATRSWMEADRPPGWEPVVQLEWGLDAERRIEPIVAYALRPEGAAIARAWLTDAVAHMDGRGVVVEVARSGVVDQGSGNR